MNGFIKITKNKLSLLILFITGLIVFSSCFNSWMPGTGLVTIHFTGSDSNGRTALWPPTDENGVFYELIHIVTLTNSMESHTEKFEQGTKSAVFDVAPGFWDITVEAWYGELPFGKGEHKAFEVQSGRNNSVFIQMNKMDHIFFGVGSWQDWLKTKESIEQEGQDKYSIIDLTGDFIVSERLEIMGGRIDVLIRGYGKTVSLNPSSLGNLLFVGEGQKITIQDVDLTGHPDNEESLVAVYGSFVMKGDSSITGNRAQLGGGVSVFPGGNFSMEGGRISGNNATEFGGGVYIEGGSFTKKAFNNSPDPVIFSNFIIMPTGNKAQQVYVKGFNDGLVIGFIDDDRIEDELFCGYAGGEYVFTGNAWKKQYGITMQMIPLSVPVSAGIPQTSFETNQYTGSVTWTPDDTVFEYGTIYIAAITLSAKEGFTFEGIQTDWFRISNVIGTEHPAGSGSTLTAIVTFSATEDVIAVTNITPSFDVKGMCNTSITLGGTVEPSNATNQVITWTVYNAGTTGATISGNILVATSEGVFVLRAEIVNGSAAGESYIQDFNIVIEHDWEWVFVTYPFVTGQLIETCRGCNAERDPHDAPPTKGLAFTLINDNGKDAYSVALGTATDAVIIIPAIHEGFPVTRVARDGFMNYQSMTGVFIPNSITFIDHNAFQNTNLTSIALPDSITSTGSNIFMNCAKLARVILPNNLSVLSNSTFRGCISLTGIDLPDSLSAIDANAFFGCTGLTEIDIPDSVEIIGTSAFMNTGLVNFTFPASVTSTGNSVLRGSEKLESVTIPYSVTLIESYAFDGCLKLTSINIPSCVTVIQNYVFRGCIALTNITIPSSVTSIGSNVFQNSRNFISITLERTAAAGITTLANVNSFENTHADLRIQVPVGSVAQYRSGANWNDNAIRERIHAVNCTDTGNLCCQ